MSKIKFKLKFCKFFYIKDEKLFKNQIHADKDSNKNEFFLKNLLETGEIRIFFNKQKLILKPHCSQLKKYLVRVFKTYLLQKLIRKFFSKC